MGSILIITIDDRKCVDPTGEWFIQEIYSGELPETHSETVNGDNHHYRLYYLVAQDLKPMWKILGRDLYISVESLPENVDVEKLAVAPDWLVDLAKDTQVEADNHCDEDTCGDADSLDPSVVRSCLAEFLSESKPIEIISTSNDILLKPFERNNRIYFNFKLFAYKVGITNTKRMPELVRLLESWGIRTRCSTTITAGDKRQVLKLCCLDKATTEGRQISLEAARLLPRTPTADLSARVRQSLGRFPH